jgi:hypothetical protein
MPTNGARLLAAFAAAPVHSPSFRTLFNTRVAHGEEAAVLPKQWAENRGRYVHFRMCSDHTSEEPDPPLGLSKHTKTIEGYLFGAPGKAPSCRT